jgi:hypothetical protein
MNEEKGLHLGRNGVPSIQTDILTELIYKIVLSQVFGLANTICTSYIAT